MYRALAPSAPPAAMPPQKKGEFPLGSFFRNFLVGGLSAMVTQTLTAPLHRAKLVLQSQGGHPLIRDGKVERYKGLFRTIIRLVRESGASSLWRGHLYDCIRFYPTSMFDFMFKDSIKKVIPKYDPRWEPVKSLLSNIFSGASAGAACLAFMWPMDVIAGVRKYDLAPRDEGSTVDDAEEWCELCYVKKRWAQGTLYTGFCISVTGIVVYRGLYLLTYDNIVSLIPYKGESGLKGSVHGFVVPQVMGLIMGAATYPLDTIRRRMQMDAHFEPQSQRRYKGTCDCFRQLYDEGTLYEGFGTSLQVGLLSACITKAYGMGKARLQAAAA